MVVFDGLCLQVPAGERLAIIGESGAGKSTLLHLLGGLDAPDSGDIFYGDCRLGHLKSRELADFRNRQLGFVWQSASLLPEFTAVENVAMPLLIRGDRRREAIARARERLREVGLEARQQHLAGELSGGEQQRVAVARALAGDPSVLLADEPTGSLDFRTGESVAVLLRELHMRHKLTSIFVTHNLSFAKSCDRVLELKKGALHPANLPEQEFSGVVRDATRLDGGTYV